MLYTTLKTGDREYKCKLATKNLVNLEKRLGMNPLNIFMNIGENNLPKLEDMLTILHESLQSLEHGISMEDVYDIYDSFIEDSNNNVDFMREIRDIYKTSGQIKKQKKADEKGKKKKKKN